MLSVGCLGKSNYCVLLIALFLTNFPPRCVFELITSILPLYFYFIFIPVCRDENSADSVVVFYYIQRIVSILERIFEVCNTIEQFHYTEFDLGSEGS